MEEIDTTNDPRHYRKRDGRILPVTGTHEPDEGCQTCIAGRTPKRVLAFTFHVGELVVWKYGARGRTHGRVLSHGRTRVSIFWHSRKARAVWISASRLEHTTPELRDRIARDCDFCKRGR